MFKNALVLTMLIGLLSSPALAEVPVQARSPNGELAYQIGAGGDGRINYSVARNGTPLIGDSQLGFLLTDAPQILRNFKLVEQASRSVDESWEQPWGEWRRVRNHYTELVTTFEETSKLHRRMRVVARLFDDAVAFRFEFPRQPNLTTANIAEELTRFRVFGDGEAWWDMAFESNREEYLYNRTKITAIGIAQTPMTIRLADGTHIAFHDAALVDYSGMNIAKVQGRLLKAVVTPSSSGPKVSGETPFVTPWRVMLITGDAASLYAANAEILHLNEPNKQGDVSWVHPCKYMGIWWGMHLDTQSWASGAKHGATTAYARKMIDFAAANGFTGLLVEGWNKGWDGDWFANGDTFSFTDTYPDFDLPGVVAYGLKKGVHFIGHNEISANIAWYEPRMGAGFDMFQKLGVDAIKTGYVSDAGGAQAVGPDGKPRFEAHEGQVMVRHHLKVVTEAAKRHIAIDAHEPVKDTGFLRTYPSWVSREGQRGMEYNVWAVPKNPPEHEANLVFTRMLSGPMDFTPGVFGLVGRGNTPIPSTLAKQLALYVVIYSPIQMAADLPENYAANPGPFQFIKDVAVDWDDTRVLAGEVGDPAVIARKTRDKNEWFVGAVGDEQERRFDVPLAILGKEKWRAEIYRDGDTADYRTNPRSIVIEKRRVTAADRLAPPGGAAVRFVSLWR